jgi:hypothetical protein
MRPCVLDLHPKPPTQQSSLLSPNWPLRLTLQHRLHRRHPTRP